MNKLAIIAFALLVFFSSMLWYLANSSLNEYLESQIRLQGYYYSGQNVRLEKASFSSNSGTVIFEAINIPKIDKTQGKSLLTINKAIVELSTNQNQPLLTEIKQITIDKLTLNVDFQDKGISDIEKLINHISLKLANDYPDQYPQISAKLYAQKYPGLNADLYANKSPQALMIVEHKKKNKTRGQPKQKVIILAIHVKNLEVNTTILGADKTIQRKNVNLTSIGAKEGIVVNQVGGELLLKLISTYNID